MTATPIQSAQPSNGASTEAPERREADKAAASRFRQTLAGRTPESDREPGKNAEPRARMFQSPGTDSQSLIASGSSTEPSFAIDSRSGVELRREIDSRPGVETRPGVESRSGLEAKPGLDARAILGPKSDSDPNPGRGQSKLAADTDRRDPNTSTLAGAVTIGSLHYSLPLAEVAAQPATTAATADINRLIEQATSVMVERASRADASRFIVSLDHAIVGGASAEFVRDGAFLHVRLISRNDAAYRSMWAHKAELEERLAASTGLTTRVEIVEGYGDGRPA